MKLGIMQPYFFPYLGYFDLINCTDRWVIFDTAQYIRHGWVNRNRILHPTEGWQYVIAPLKKHSLTSRIMEVETLDDPKWRRRIVGQLQHYKKSAPYFRMTASLVEDCMNMEEQCLARLNAGILAKVCAHLGISFHYQFFSQMGLEMGPVEGPGDWALRISEALGAAEYVNPPGGEELFDRDAFEKAGIKLTLRHLPPLEYGCDGYAFVPALSIIDVLMWNSTETIKAFLDAHRAT